METRTSWGIVVVAGVFAIVAIGVAVGTYFFENNGKGQLSTLWGSAGPNDEDGDGLATWEELAWHTDPKNPDTDGDGVSDGDEVKARTDPTIAGTGADAYAQWGGYTPTERLGVDLAVAENALAAANASPEDMAATINVVAQQVKKPNVAERITLDALNIGNSISLEAYSKVLLAVLQQSIRVRTYELAAFSETIAAHNTSGTPALKEAATVYKQIEAALIVMEVPQKIALEHLAVVNAVGTLANIVNVMATWSGDPIAGLVYTDTFIESENAVDASVEALITKVSTLLQTP